MADGFIWYTKSKLNVVAELRIGELWKRHEYIDWQNYGKDVKIYVLVVVNVSSFEGESEG